jgi:hypothetical protein
LVGHHRKAHPGFAGARRFDRGVERQDVGLTLPLRRPMPLTANATEVASATKAATIST